MVVSVDNITQTLRDSWMTLRDKVKKCNTVREIGIEMAKDRKESVENEYIMELSKVEAFREEKVFTFISFCLFIPCDVILPLRDGINTLVKLVSIKGRFPSFIG